MFYSVVKQPLGAGHWAIGGGSRQWSAISHASLWEQPDLFGICVLRHGFFNPKSVSGETDFAEIPCVNTRISPPLKLNERQHLCYRHGIFFSIVTALTSHCSAPAHVAKILCKFTRNSVLKNTDLFPIETLLQPSSVL